MSKRGVVFLGGGWQSKYRLPYSSTPPSVVLDFVNQRYYDGSGPATLASLIANPGTINANGMQCTAVNIAAIGKLLTVFQQQACTVRVETNLGSNATTPAGSLVGFNNDSLNAPLFQGAGQNLQSFTGGTQTRTASPLVDWNKFVYSGATWDRSTSNICVNAGDTVNGFNNTNVYPIPTTVNIGSSWGTFPFGGYIRTLAVWSQKVAAKELQSICWPIPYVRPRSGTRGAGFGNELNGIYLSPGPAYQYERTQPWTIITGFTQRIRPALAAVFSTNVGGSAPWYGYEFWIDGTGMLRVRIMGNWPGGGPGSAGIIDVIGTTNVCDALPHVAAATYDGSSTAAGVKIYLDGMLQTVVVVDNNLSSSIVSGTPSFYVGNQLNSNFGVNFMDYYQLHNTARSAAYIAANSAGALPPIDANTVLSYDLEEGTGNTTADGSGHGFTATLNNAYWIAP